MKSAEIREAFLRFFKEKRHTRASSGKRTEQAAIGFKWIGLVCALTSALLTSLRIDPLNIYLGNVGCALYLIWAIRIKDLNLSLVNGGLLAIYIFGIFVKPH